MAVTWPRSARSDRPVMSTAGSVLTVASLGAPPAAGRPRRAQQPGAPAKPLNPEFNGTQPVQRHIERVAGRHAHQHARAWLTAGTGRSGVLGGAGGHVERGIAVEEADRLEPERDRVDGHHRPVLWPGDVVDAEHVPQHHVGVLDRPVPRGPDGQALIALALRAELTARPALVRMVGGDPEGVA